MTSLQVPSRTADESQQATSQVDDDFYEQIEAPVTVKVSYSKQNTQERKR
jgi:hypothetical protein